MAYTSMARTIEELNAAGLGDVKDRLEQGQMEFLVEVNRTEAVMPVRHLLYSLLFHMGINRLYRIKVRGTELEVKRKYIGMSTKDKVSSKPGMYDMGFPGKSLDAEAAKVPTQEEADAEADEFMAMLED